MSSPASSEVSQVASSNLEILICKLRCLRCEVDSEAHAQTLEILSDLGFKLFRGNEVYVRSDVADNLLGFVAKVCRNNE